MDREQLRKYTEKILTDKTPILEQKAKVQFFNQLWRSNILDQERVLKAAINHYYSVKFKENDCHTKNSVLDTAIYFEVSISTVKNTIYKYSHVSLRF